MPRAVFPSTTSRQALRALSCMVLTAPLPVLAAPDDPSRWAWFAQAGKAEDARMLAVGAARDWRWNRPLGRGELNGYWELTLGHWRGERDQAGVRNADGASTSVTQFGLTPVLRWEPGASGRWFLEAGIGLNVITPAYSTGDKRFSTRFNFGDHLGVGWKFGAALQHELSLRLQHFSNAGIRRPNPGEDFLQLRYLARF